MTTEQRRQFNRHFDVAIRDKAKIEMAVGYLRYEALRRLNPTQFAELHRRNLAGERFDDIVDEMIGGEE